VKYKTSAAFRRALEERLRQQSLEGGQPLTRLRKMVAFDRFLARLAKKEPEAWIVKGGFALQLRLGTRARTTKDIDVSLTNRWTREETTAHLQAVAFLVFGDWFEFQVSEPTEAATGAPAHGLRFPIRCLLDGRQFENFHLDVGYGDPVLETPDVLTGPDLAAFAGIAPATVRCYLSCATRRRVRDSGPKTRTGNRLRLPVSGVRCFRRGSVRRALPTVRTARAVWSFDLRMHSRWSQSYLLSR
jgi:hypothetical protein